MYGQWFSEGIHWAIKYANYHGLDPTAMVALTGVSK